MVKQSQNAAQHQQLVNEISQSETFFRSLSNCCPVGIFATDTDGHCTYINPRCQSIYGFSSEESLGESWTQFVHVDERESVLTEWLTHTHQGSEFSRQCRFQTPQGRSGWVHVRSAPVLNDENNLIGYVNTVEDTTEYKQAEDNSRQLTAQIQEQANVLNAILCASVDHIYVFDRTGRYQYVSQGGANVMGYQPEELSDKAWRDLNLPTDVMERVDAQRAVVMATGQPIRAETEYLGVDGMHYYEYILTPWRNPDETIEGVITISRDITDRVQAVEALRLSKEHYRSLVESLPQLVCMAGADGITQYCNQSWMNYTGLSLEQTQGSGLQQAFHPNDVPLVIERWTQALETGNAYSIEFRIRRVDGVYRWHLSRIVPIKAQEDRIVGWLGIATDIDDQKRTEQQDRFLAQASQTFAAASLELQTVLDTITRLVSEFTGDVCVLSLLSENGLWLDPVSGYHIDPEVREFVSEVFSSYPCRADEGIEGQVMQTGEPLLMPVTSQQKWRAVIKPEYQLYLERFRVYSTLIVPLKVQGKAIGVLSLTRNHPGEPHNTDDQSLFQDLADRAAMAIANARLYQQAQQASQQAVQTADRTTRLQAVTAALSESLTPAQVAEVIVAQSIAVLNAASAMVVIVSESGTELEIVHQVGYQQDVSQQWRRFPITTPVPLAEAIRTGQPIWEESTQERIARYPHLAENYAHLSDATWISLPLMVEGRAVGGISINFAQFSPLSKDDRAFMLALAQQCAQAIARACLYEAEQRARASAEAANRIKDEFLAVLSHELRSPLNPILGWAKLLRTRKFDEQATNRALETIERNATLQTKLIEDLLDVSRILRGKMVLNVSPVNLTTTIEAALETVRLAAESKGIQIQTSLAPNVGLVSADSDRLQQVVWNLLSNAVKFTPSGGRVEVRVEQDACCTQIMISDTGKGINPKFLPYVFERFRQEDGKTTRTFGGLGLGLAIVRHLVELHGGTVQAESLGEGQGATFTVKLPLTAIGKQTDHESELLVTAFNLSQLRILVVDDEADMRELLVTILEPYGAEVLTTASAAEALSVLDQFKPDVLISDIGMPEVDGYMLMRQVRRLLPQQRGLIPALSEAMPKAIALTAYAGELNQQQALEAGFQKHVAKPVEPDELVKTIAALVGRSCNGSSEVS